MHRKQNHLYLPRYSVLALSLGENEDIPMLDQNSLAITLHCGAKSSEAVAKNELFMMSTLEEKQRERKRHRWQGSKQENP